MKVCVVIECRFLRSPDGRIWQQAQFSYNFWRRYLEVFDEVRIVARVRDVARAEEDWIRVDGPGVTLHPIPVYIGPIQYALRMQEVRRSLEGFYDPGDAVILRTPGNLVNLAGSRLIRSGYPFAVEVVADPYELFTSQSAGNPGLYFFRWWFTRQTKRQCRLASASLYVTSEALQQRYPPSPQSYTVGCSDVELDEDAFVPAPRTFSPAKPPTKLVHIGTFDQLYKAADVLIDAVAQAVGQGTDLQLSIAGDGKFRPDLERQAASLGLADRVRFLGYLSGPHAVRAALDAADVFLLPSRTEGLPRAMIEAMARGLPCLGTTVGGIPELLAPTEMVPPDDVQALASAITDLSSNPDRSNRLSARNLEVAQRYRDDRLRGKRQDFYGRLRDLTYEACQARP